MLGRLGSPDLAHDPLSFLHVLLGVDLRHLERLLAEDRPRGIQPMIPSQSSRNVVTQLVGVPRGNNTLTATDLRALSRLLVGLVTRTRHGTPIAIRVVTI